MKHLVLAAFSALFINGQVLAQAKIASAEVSRIMKTLTADNMNGRKVFTPGLDRAATFIQAEFKKAGLQPLPDAKSLEQPFNVYEVTPVSSSVTLDNANIPSESNLILTGSKKVQWPKTQATAVLARIEAADNMGQKFQEAMRSSRSGLVIIDPAHAEMFKRYKNHSSQSNIKTSLDSTTVVFVVSSNKNPQAVEVKAQHQIISKPLKNIVGYLPGKSRPQEFVVFSAHYDHIGVLQPVNGDSIANGADDDASGTTAVIMLANYFKKLKNNERSLVFVAFTAEEVGGYGSQYFSKQLNPQKVTAMFNIEMIGKESQFGKNAGFITGFDKSDFGKIVQQNLAGSKYTFHPDPYLKENLFYRSDNATLARLGVPAHTLSTDKIDTDKLYHSVDDEFESLNVANMTNIIEAIAQGARSIVAGKDAPARIRPEDVK